MSEKSDVWPVRAAVLTAALLAVFAVTCGWLTEDAYINLRVVDNMVSGHGPVWNQGQRVQAFTSPLWLLLVWLASSTVADPEKAALFLPGPLMFCAAVTLSRLPHVRTGAAGCLAALSAPALLMCSKSFRDWMSGGLENPLLFVALALSAAIVSRMSAGRRATSRDFRDAALMLSALTLTRPDAPVLWAACFLPFLLTSGGAAPAGRWKGFLTGLAPLLAWEAFSMFYYGSPVPNTALAKLPPGYPAWNLAAKGLVLMLDTMMSDPLCVLFPLAAPAVLLASGADKRFTAAAALVPALFLPAVLFEGGDYMLGRLPSGALVMSAALTAAGMSGASSAALRRAAIPLTVTLLMCAASLWAPTAMPSGAHPFLSVLPRGVSPEAAVNTESGVVDEKAFFSRENGFFPIVEGASHEFRTAARKTLEPTRGRYFVMVLNNIGFAPREFGVKARVIDPLGLAEPFLARLPSCHAGTAGHFPRNIPDGYVETVIQGENMLAAGMLKDMLDDVLLATEAPLTAPGRAAAVFRLTFKRPPADRLRDEVSRTTSGIRPEDGCSWKPEQRVYMYNGSSRPRWAR